MSKNQKPNTKRQHLLGEPPKTKNQKPKTKPQNLREKIAKTKDQSSNNQEKQPADTEIPFVDLPNKFVRKIINRAFFPRLG